MDEYNGQMNIDAEAPSPEAAALTRIERDVTMLRAEYERVARLQSIGLSMIIALVSGHGVEMPQIEAAISALGGERSTIVRP